MHTEEDLLDRVSRLEEELDKLTDVVKVMSDRLKEIDKNG